MGTSLILQVFGHKPKYWMKQISRLMMTVELTGEGQKFVEDIMSNGKFYVWWLAIMSVMLFVYYHGDNCVIF